MSASCASSAVLTTSAALGPALGRWPTCACRAGRRAGRRSRARARRAASRRRRCRARRRRPARSPPLARCGRGRRSGLRRASAVRRAVGDERGRRRWRRDRGRWRARARRRGAQDGAGCSRRRRRCRQCRFRPLPAPAPAALGEAARERGAAVPLGTPSAGRVPRVAVIPVLLPRRLYPPDRGGSPRRTICDGPGLSRGRARGALRSARAPTSGISGPGRQT